MTCLWWVFLPWKLNGLEIHVWRFTISRDPSGPMMQSKNTKTNIRSGPIWHRYGGGSFQHMICLFIMMKTWYYRSWKKSGQTVVINKTLQIWGYVWYIQDCFINNIIRKYKEYVLERLWKLQSFTTGGNSLKLPPPSKSHLGLLP